MKPKNKFQARIVDASKTLPKITKTQIQWGYNNAIQYVGRRTDKGVITCTKCGHSWHEMGELSITLLGCDCPNCGTHLCAGTTRKRTFNGRYYMTIITTHKGYQVLRTILLEYSAKIGEETKLSHHEVMQRWIDHNGKHCTFAKLRQTMGTYYYDAWILYTDLELRSESAYNKYNINIYDRMDVGELYPRQRLIPELKRTGLKKEFFKQKPSDLFRTLLSDSRAETLLKTGYSNLLGYMMNNGWDCINKYWQSIKICIRNDYKITDATLWFDYIDMLRFFGKDLHNAKYVCPNDLKAEHDRYVAKKIKYDTQLQIEKQLEKEAEYREAKARFFGLMFSDGTISVHFLESVKEIIAEGKVMHHCVRNYSTKEDSLIFSATINGERIETVEVSISKLKVLQSRGVCNKNTEHHDRIIKLVEQNISLIEDRLAA